MLVRLWETRFDPTRKAELVDYANDISLPVLASRPGCCGVLFFSQGDRWITQTIWSDQRSLEALGTDPDYTRIVAGILALNVLQLEQTTTVYEVSGGTNTFCSEKPQ
ncbi:hypothetical protein [Pseudosulfitobacter koreensis]|uniref:Antibiotic biosynthesis monooxygenase n=1 Tax=Pseudosulfitobacter koreensis TaxID=2968472 RepID=A0ABT1Z409_9RHOB|nr:hypothetical protein [Pseudosulfitobacter koreense]MCR8827870.1 hypothetical protein [Pseudosulfitobacter koreense]